MSFQQGPGRHQGNVSQAEDAAREAAEAAKGVVQSSRDSEEAASKTWLRNDARYREIARQHARSITTLYLAAGLGILAIAASTYFSVQSVLSHNIAVDVLTMISTLIGLLTMVYGLIQGRTIMHVAELDLLESGDTAASSTRFTRSGTGNLTIKAERRGGGTIVGRSPNRIKIWRRY